MDKDFKLNDKQMNLLMNLAKKKSGLNLDKLQQSAENGDIGNFLDKNMDPKSASKLKEVLTNKESAKNILNTPEAQALIRKMLEEK